MCPGAFETTAVNSEEITRFLFQAVGTVTLRYVVRQTSFASSNVRHVIILRLHLTSQAIKEC